MEFKAISTTTGRTYKVSVEKKTAKTLTFTLHDYFSKGGNRSIRKCIREDNQYSDDNFFLIIVPVEEPESYEAKQVQSVLESREGDQQIHLIIKSGDSTTKTLNINEEQARAIRYLL